MQQNLNQKKLSVEVLKILMLIILSMSYHSLLRILITNNHYLVYGILLNLFFCNISNKHAPNRVYRIKGKAQPWVTDDVVSAMKERDLIHK